jgi:hypothetical protein
MFLKNKRYSTLKRGPSSHKSDAVKFQPEVTAVVSTTNTACQVMLPHATSGHRITVLKEKKRKKKKGTERERAIVKESRDRETTC